MINLNKINNNFTRVNVNGVDIFFSYETAIAFIKNGKITITKNMWSNTTGKHLNYISVDKSIRIYYADFQTKLNQLVL